MRQWLHLPELTKYLESQRAIARAIMPGTPSVTGQPPRNADQEHIQRLGRCVAALHSLRRGLSNYPELVEHVDHVLEYVSQLQGDYATRDSTRTFDRLTHLRSMILWTASHTLQAGESNLAPLAMVAHFYALAIVIEPLFPEYGGLYLGNLSLESLENICQMIYARSAKEPPNIAARNAAFMLEVPQSIAHAYRTGERILASQNTPYEYHGQKPVLHSDFSMQSYHVSPPGSTAQHGSFHSSGLQSPVNIVQPAYHHTIFQSSPISQQGSELNRVYSHPRIGAEPPLQSYASSHIASPNMITPDTNYFGGPATYSMPTYGNMSDLQSRFVCSQVWT